MSKNAPQPCNASLFSPQLLTTMRRKHSPSGFELLRDNKLRVLGDHKDRGADCRSFVARAAAAQRVQRGLDGAEDVFDAAQGSAIFEAEDGVFRKGSRPFSRLELFLDICGGFFSSELACDHWIVLRRTTRVNAEQTDRIYHDAENFRKTVNEPVRRTLFRNFVDRRVRRMGHHII